MADTKVSKLTQIYKAEKAAGGGLATALGKASLEKIDPRQFFNQKGLLAAVFPSLFKAYKAPIKTDVAKTTPSIAQFSTSILESKIDDLSTHAKISAKNSLVLPSMARDMNLTRQNIAKLVKLQGGKPTYKSDMFFQRAAEREAAYESQFKRERPVGTAAATRPTPTKAEETGGGFFDKLLKGLAIGGLIGGLVFSAFKFLKDKVQAFYDDTVKQIEDIYNDIKSTVLTQFNKVKEKISSIIDEITIDNLKEAAQSFLNRIVSAIKNIPTGFGGTPGAPTTGGESPENPDITPSTVSPGLGAVQDEAERKGRVGPRGQQVEIKDGVVGYYRNIGRTGRGSQGKREFTPLQGEDLINYYSEQIKKAQDLSGGETLTANQLNNLSLAKTEAGRAAIEQYMKQNNIMSPTLTPVPPEAGRGTNRAPTPLKTGEYGQEKRFPGLLDMIASGEAISKDPYNSMNQGTPGGKISGSGISSNIIGQNLTDMTVGEILSKAPNKNDSAEQRKEKGSIFAAGRYQIIPDTLQGLVNKNVVSKDEKFTPEVQDRLGMALVEQSGATKSIDEGDLDKAQYQLAKVWASLPVPAGMALKSGQVSTGVESFYGGANKAKENLTLAALDIQQTRQPSMTVAAFQRSDKDITPVSTPVQTLAAVTPMPDTMKTVLRSEAGKLNAATIEVAQARVQIGSAPIIVPPPAVNVQAPQVQAGGGGGMMAASSVVDTEFMKLLVGRTVTI